MITVTGYRMKGNSRYELPTQQKSPAKALQSMVEFELGYGGYVVDYTKQGDLHIITTRTNVLESIDTCSWQGTWTEMELLCKVALHHTNLQGEEEKKIILGKFFDHWEEMGDKAGSPFFLKHVGMMQIGASEARMALILAFYNDEEKLKADLEVQKKFTLKDLIPALLLMKETGTPLGEMV